MEIKKAIVWLKFVIQMWSKTARFSNLWKKMHLFCIVSSQANFRNKFFDQKSPRHPEVDFFLGGGWEWSKTARFNSLGEKPHELSF